MKSSGPCWAANRTLAYEPWPDYEPELTRDETIEVPIQIKGKVRAKVQVPADIDKNGLLEVAKADERIQELLEGKTIVKEVVVPGRLVNFVVK